MTKDRDVEAYCATCGDVRSHHIDHDDPGSCVCAGCGTVQQLVTPLE